MFVACSQSGFADLPQDAAGGGSPFFVRRAWDLRRGQAWNTSTNSFAVGRRRCLGDAPSASGVGKRGWGLGGRSLQLRVEGASGGQHKNSSLLLWQKHALGIRGYTSTLFPREDNCRLAPREKSYTIPG